MNCPLMVYSRGSREDGAADLRLFGLGSNEFTFDEFSLSEGKGTRVQCVSRGQDVAEDSLELGSGGRFRGRVQGLGVRY